MIPFAYAYSYDEEDEDKHSRKTWPPPGSADLTVEHVCTALFLSATWHVVVRVGDEVLSRSESCDTPRSKDFIDSYARLVIKAQIQRLRELGVDPVAVYVRHGGKPSNL